VKFDIMIFQNQEIVFSTLLSSFHHMVYKIFFIPASSFTFLTTHQDGCVRLFDLRKKTDNENNILIKLTSGKASANSLAFSPRTDQFILGGADPYLRLYDMRYLRNGKNDIETPCIAKFIPPSLINGDKDDSHRFYITGVDYNACNEVVATYSKEDVYLFDVTSSLDSNGICTTPKQVYKGRRNVQTFLKEVSFFGGDSYVTTGSDCGHLFIWEKNSGKLVQLLKADKNVVNGVAPHPYLPVLAVCGIDSSGKIFECGDNPTFVDTYARKLQDKNDTLKIERRNFQLE